jgi:hypothetical protein
VTTTSRIFPIFLCALFLLCAPARSARAGFFGGDESKSGLDFTRGYDVNTVSTVSGRVISQPHPAEQENVVVEIRSGKDTLNVSVGPASYWEKQGIAISMNDELTVKGSKAQGKNGKTYLLAQKLVNRTTGAQLELRNDTGEAAWSGKAAGGTRSSGPAGSMGGGMMRSGGGMMRGGGGGMMRR